MDNIPRSPEEYRQWWAGNTDVPYGYCWCGCGRKTHPSKQTRSERQQVKGEPVPYVQYHYPRTHRAEKMAAAARSYKEDWERKRPDVPYGYCWCGCGEKTNPMSCSKALLGKVQGEPEKYRYGHASRKSSIDCVSEERGYTTPCWIWQRANTGKYGFFSVNKRTVYAHRHYYEQVYGPIPDGLLIHHLCEQTFCVNPSHLVPVTRSEHQRIHKGR